MSLRNANKYQINNYLRPLGANEGIVISCSGRKPRLIYGQRYEMESPNVTSLNEFWFIEMMVSTVCGWQVSDSTWNTVKLWWIKDEAETRWKKSNALNYELGAASMWHSCSVRREIMLHSSIGLDISSRIYRKRYHQNFLRFHTIYLLGILARLPCQENENSQQRESYYWIMITVQRTNGELMPEAIFYFEKFTCDTHEDFSLSSSPWATFID